MTTEANCYSSHALLPSRRVRERYHISSRTLSRWRLNAKLGFPVAVVINGRYYFDEVQLNDWERSRLADANEAVS